MDTNINTNVNKIFAAVEKQEPKWEVLSIFDMGNYYIFSMVPKKLFSTNSEMVDCLQRLDPKTGKIVGFSPSEDREKFIKAVQNPVYMRKEPRKVNIRSR